MTLDHYTAEMDRIKALSDAEAQDLFRQLAIQLTGSERWQTDIARMLDYQPRAVRVWMEDGGRPKNLATFTLTQLADLKRYQDAVSLAQRAQEALSSLSEG